MFSLYTLINSDLFIKNSTTSDNRDNPFSETSLNLIEQLFGLLASNGFENEVEKFSQRLRTITRNLNKSGILSPSTYLAGHFEWIDGMLIRAVVQGDWLLIDNANLCPASVLDRINPLLEPNGSLSLIERGSLDGTVQKVLFLYFSHFFDISTSKFSYYSNYGP